MKAPRYPRDTRRRPPKSFFERLEYLSVPYELMPEILNQYRAVVLDPIMLHAFGRLAVEALACGCRVLASDRVGAMSWPDPLQACAESNQRFWEMVMNLPARPNMRRLRITPFATRRVCMRGKLQPAAEVRR